jgi:hypothetical protein
MDDEPNPLESILEFQASKLRGSPGGARVAKLAKTAKRVPTALINDLEVLILQLDTELVGADLALAVIGVAYLDERVGDATDFAAAFRSRLQRYIRCREVADAAREEFKKRIAWWRAAIGRAFELRQWPAITLTEPDSNGEGAAICATR